MCHRRLRRKESQESSVFLLQSLLGRRPLEKLRLSKQDQLLLSILLHPDGEDATTMKQMGLHGSEYEAAAQLAALT
jgi:hypothetical protein